MSTDLAAWRKRLRENLDDDTVRLVFADWLEENPRYARPWSSWAIRNNVGFRADLRRHSVLTLSHASAYRNTLQLTYGAHIMMQRAWRGWKYRPLYQLFASYYELHAYGLWPKPSYRRWNNEPTQDMPIRTAGDSAVFWDHLHNRAVEKPENMPYYCGSPDFLYTYVMMKTGIVRFFLRVREDFTLRFSPARRDPT